MFKIIQYEKFVQNRVVAYFRSYNVWTKEKVVVSPFKDVDIPDVTISEYIWSKIHRWPNKIAVVCGVTDRKYSYNQLYKASQCLAANLRTKFKIKDGDMVAVMMPNLPEYPITVLGIQSAGGAATTLNPIYTPYEVKKQLELSNTKLIFTTPELVPTVKEALKLNKQNIPIIVMDLITGRPEGTVSYYELIGDDVDLSVLKDVKIRPSDVAVLPYSSGTTGLPKGVELTHRNLVANCQQQTTECRHYEHTTDTNQDTLLALLPMFHSYGLSVVMFSGLSAGLKLVTLPKFQASTFVEALENFKMNIMYLAPPTLLFLATHPEVKSEQLDQLRSVTIGAAPSPKTDIENFMKKVNREFHFGQAYGLTETAPLATIAPLGFKNYASVGFPVPNTQLRIVDENLNNLGPDEVGELLLRGPNIMKGYRDNPEANRNAFVDGWFRSGDLASINEEGAVTIADRLKELIKVKGYQVPPAELESVLKEHEAVFDAAVVGAPDPSSGQKPKAFVVLNNNSKARESEILEFVNEKVAAYKRIKDIVILDAIPKNPSGKILRRVLVQKYC
ncbi:uncharacterized protein LOC126966678 [Leptidea sinapis]|uniref:uncharacterized protein LOC126966678 n=1 Tax=Leptidea sinapis TaxID=189913 RepID=UPI0021305FD3|nr:uncharacterized protein LOC126966678 [Leptidea sinapis]